MKRICLMAVLVLGAVSPLAGQATSRSLPSELRDGRRALSFGAFVGGGGMIGLTFMVSPRTAFTLDLQGDARSTSIETMVDDEVLEERDQLEFEVLLAPGIRRYMAGRGDVASYVAGRLLLGFEGRIAEFGESRLETWVPTAGAAAGFGLEWFVTDGMSVRGEATAQASYRRATFTGPTDDEETVSETFEIGLGQSGLAIAIWF